MFRLAVHFTILILSGSAVAAEPMTKDWNAFPDVLYAETAEGKLKLDLVVPKGAGPHPCVICFHGGAWRAGNRKDLTKASLFGTPEKKDEKEFNLLEMLVKQGYAACSVSYRLAPKSRFPAQIEDAKTAVRFLRKNAADYKLDPDRFAALGFSAGGHLASLLGVTDSTAGFDGKLYPETASRVQTVIDYFGPTDMTLYAETPSLVEGFLVPLFGQSVRTDSQLLAKASPIEYVTKQSPPTLIVHGNLDFVVPIIHSERFYKKLTEAGVKTEFLVMKGKSHGWAGSEGEPSSKVLVKFLDDNLKAKK